MVQGKFAVLGVIGLCAMAACIGAYALLAPPESAKEQQVQPPPVTASVTCSAPANKVPPVPDWPLRKMIGQLLVVGFSGRSADDAWPSLLANQLKQGQIGGVLFLGKNVSNAEKTRRLIQSFVSQETALPPLLMIDQEGGRVQRLGPRVGVARIPSAKAIADHQSSEQAQDVYAGMAQTLSAWGLNTNLGPVADVRVNPASPVIARLGRSYSSNAADVAEYAAAFVRAHRGAGILTALKHFPGHGSSKTDSHRGLTDISESWQKGRELAPFRSLIEGGCADMVMTGHLVLKNYGEFAGSAAPATFSAHLISHELRGQMGFDGVVITDDLDMGAIRRYYTLEQSLIGAIRAGHDILLHSNIITAERNLPALAIESLHAEALEDPEFERRLRESFERVWILKSRLSRSAKSTATR